ncbi:T9SS type A sorting domain-containing protein [candidate division KSB1 bacterium]|nr:T9SS type A sorting domain-containing protein [candidate division KSB1 bacterium]
MAKSKYIRLVTFSAIVLMTAAFVFPQSRSAFVITMNGHPHTMAEDLVDRAVQEWFDAAKDSFDMAASIDSLAQTYDLQVRDFRMPRDIHLQYLVDSTGANDFMGRLAMDSIRLVLSGYDCRFDAILCNVGLIFGGNGYFEDGAYRLNPMEPEILRPVVTMRDSGDSHCPVLANAFKPHLVNSAKQVVSDFAQDFNALVNEELFTFINPIASLGIEDKALLKAAFESFPLNMNLYTQYGDDHEIVQLVVAFDFLTGTVAEPTKFIGLKPDPPARSRLSIGGFSYSYWGLQRGFPWHTDWDESQCVEAAFTTMDSVRLNGYRLEVRWRHLQKQVYRGANLDPDNLEPIKIDSLFRDPAHWDTTEYARLQEILNDGFSRGLKPFMAIGWGHLDGLPVDENGSIIAPATDAWQPVEGFVRVDANEYLYNLKVYAHAVVRRFADYVSAWQIENELNAAGWAAAVPGWWRKGDLWLDADFCNRVWSILLDAVRTHDPTALVVHDLHMLGFMQGLEHWGADMDIVGFNFYPNLSVALPVLGFSVGEYVWAVRRALTGLGYADKPVWVVESGYPAIHRDDPPENIRLAEDVVYFSETRQQQYIESALTSAVEQGACGFFYYSLTTPENYGEGGPELDRYLRFCGLIRAQTDQPKSALLPFAILFNQYLVQTQVDNMAKNPPASESLYQNYPNPFNSATTIVYELEQPAHVLLTIFNIRGEQIAILVDENQQSGVHRIQWNGSNHASGMYFYCLKAGGYCGLNKMIVLH